MRKYTRIWTYHSYVSSYALHASNCATSGPEFASPSSPIIIIRQEILMQVSTLRKLILRLLIKCGSDTISHFTQIDFSQKSLDNYRTSSGQ